MPRLLGEALGQRVRLEKVEHGGRRLGLRHGVALGFPEVLGRAGPRVATVVDCVLEHLRIVLALVPCPEVDFGREVVRALHRGRVAAVEAEPLVHRVGDRRAPVGGAASIVRVDRVLEPMEGDDRHGVARVVRDGVPEAPHGSDGRDGRRELRGEESGEARAARVAGGVDAPLVHRVHGCHLTDHGKGVRDVVGALRVGLRVLAHVEAIAVALDDHRKVAAAGLVERGHVQHLLGASARARAHEHEGHGCVCICLGRHHEDELAPAGEEIPVPIPAARCLAPACKVAPRL
mmetsp:Transcript_12609/g.42651  ORF Transcript_12609/g.42651 Transcript_12609/m.42651 type:complete len:290 (+) Transcript_12609:748-1617(+)